MVNSFILRSIPIAPDRTSTSQHSLPSWASAKWVLFLVGAACISGCAGGDASPINDGAFFDADHSSATDDGAFFDADHPSGALSRASQPLSGATPSTRSDVVAILSSRGFNEQLCTGTLLLPDLVLTARHCLIADRAAASGDCTSAIVPEPDETTRVVAIPSADVDLAPADTHRVVREYLLPEDEGRLCGQDLALVVLDTPIQGTLATISATVPAAGPFGVVGYGLFDGDWGQQRQSASATLICSGATCNDARLVARELLVNSGACEGDSGGPLFDAQGQQFALLSRTTADCTESAYLALSDYVPWLQTATKYAASKGGYPLPAWADTSPKPSDETVATPVEESSTSTRATGGGGCSVSGVRANVASRSVTGGLLLFFALALCRRCRGRRSRVASLPGHPRSTLRLLGLSLASAGGPGVPRRGRGLSRPPSLVAFPRGD